MAVLPLDEDKLLQAFFVPLPTFDAFQESIWALFRNVATELIEILPPGPDMARGMRSLLEARDAFLGAAITPAGEDHSDGNTNV